MTIFLNEDFIVSRTDDNILHRNTLYTRVGRYENISRLLNTIIFSKIFNNDIFRNSIMHNDILCNSIFDQTADWSRETVR